MRVIIGFLLLLVVAIMLLTCGCSAKWHLRRALSKEPGILRRDTVIRIDSVILAGVNLDTVVTTGKDTITLTKDNLVIKYLTLPGDRVYISGECKADTVIIKVKIPQIVIRENPLAEWFDKNKLWLIVGGVILAGAVLVKLVT